MIYFIIEGERGKSEYKFWDTFLRSISHPFKIETTNGNGQGLAVTRRVIRNAQRGDIVILGLDSYTIATYRICRNLLAHEARRKGFSYGRLGARSFEGIFVSYTPLLSLVKQNNQMLCNIFNDVALHLINRIGFHVKLDIYKHQLEAIGLHPKANTEEQFVAWILAQVTRRPWGRRINKGEIGDCWLIDCCNVQSNNTKAACPDGGNLHITYHAKMYNLEQHSLMKNNTFSLSSLAQA